MVKQNKKKLMLVVRYLKRANTIAKKLRDQSASDSIVEAMNYIEEQLELL